MPLKTNCSFVSKWVAVLFMSFLKHRTIRRLPLSADFIIPCKIPHLTFAHHALVALSPAPSLSPAPAPSPSLPPSRSVSLSWFSPALGPSPTLMYQQVVVVLVVVLIEIILRPALGPAPTTPCCIWPCKPISTLIYPARARAEHCREGASCDHLVESNWNQNSHQQILLDEDQRGCAHALL